jgi:hypothetical protein
VKAIKIVLVLLLVYVGIVATFESLLGYFQPADGNTMVITTFDDDGNGAERVVSKLESDGKLYVAANHWPRAWYRQALKKPEVKLTMNGETHDYLVVPIDDAEFERVNSENPVGPIGRFLMGYPPRRIVRLDPA